MYTVRKIDSIKKYIIRFIKYIILKLFPKKIKKDNIEYIIKNKKKYDIKLDYLQTYTLNDITQVCLNKHKYVWIGNVYGGNYDLFTGLCYFPYNINLNSIGTLMERNKYYKMFNSIHINLYT